MAIDLDDLFAKLGKLGGGLNELNAARGAELLARWSDITGAYGGEEELLDGLWSSLGQNQQAGSAWASALARMAEQTVVDIVNADVLLEDRSLAAAVRELIRQMDDASESVEALTLGASVAADPGNVGNPTWVLSTKRPDGLDCVYLLAEDLACTCTADAQPGGGATAGRETVRVRGEQAQGDKLAQDWPLGSGASQNLTIISAADRQGGFGQNLLNGDFSTWDEAVSSGSDGSPVGWTVRTGSVGAQVEHESGGGYIDDGLAIVGDGSTLTQIDQTFGSVASQLEPLRQYAVHLRCKMDSAPGAGVLRVALVDGFGSVTTDEQGAANSFTIDLTTLGTSWVARTGVFRTPRQLPATLRLELKLTTALSASRTLLVDEVSLARMREIYAGGPSASLFAGDTDPIRQDSWTITATTDASETAWHRLLDRLLGMVQIDLVVPSSGSPTLSDTLIA